jgi:hypothetical protein
VVGSGEVGVKRFRTIRRPELYSSEETNVRLLKHKLGR